MTERLSGTSSGEEKVQLQHHLPDFLPTHNTLTKHLETVDERVANLNIGHPSDGHLLNHALDRPPSIRSSRRSGSIDLPIRALTSGASRPGSSSSLYNAIFNACNLTKWEDYTPKEPSPLPSPKRAARSRASSRASIHTNYATLRQLEAAEPPKSPHDASSLGSPLIHPHAFDVGSSLPTEVILRNMVNETTDESHRYSGMRESVGEEMLHIEGEMVDQDRLDGNTGPHDEEGTVNDEETNVPEPLDEEHRRSPSNASTRTFQPSLFNDFDGAHYSSTMEDLEETDEFDTYGDRSRITWAEPEPMPRDSMVYYPAPVPRMLNLPQRLSVVPSARTQGKRRTQIMDSVPTQTRKSTVWSPHNVNRDSEIYDVKDISTNDKRASQRTSKRVSVVPPQLRASAFFEHQSIPQAIQVKDESAVATLDDFLDASASAPADAFTDHPIVGNVLRDVYAKERSKDQNRRSTFSALNGEKSDSRKSKTMLSGSRSSIQQFSRLKGRSSSKPDLSRKRETINDNGEHAIDDKGYLMDNDDYGLEPSTAADVDNEDNDDAEEYTDDADLEEDEEEVPEEDFRSYGPPTTLLAELQMRKAELKQRNRTAIQAFPNGLHATLLELDAVAQIEKKKRRGQRTALAWEDPSVLAAADEAVGDDEIPLGMLFPPKNRLINRVGGDDWDRPLGLIEKKHREDNEPLSSRRNRLRGISPVKVAHQASQLVDQDSPDEDSEHEGETLAERTRRLKTLEVLNSALPDKSRPVSADFASEVMSQLGVSEEAVESATVENRQNIHADADETLGQRRKRLQAEEHARQLAVGNGQQWNQSLATSASWANILAPINGTMLPRPSDTIVQPKFVGRHGGLLSLNEQHQAEQRQELFKHNMGMRIPANDDDQMKSPPAFSGLLGQDDQARARLRREISMQNLASRQFSNESQQTPIASNGLLGLHDQQREYQREQMMEQTKRNTSMLNVDPSMAQPKQTYAGGRFNDGTGGVVYAPPAYDSLQQSMFYNNMNMRSPNVNPGYGAIYNPGFSQMMSQPNLSSQYGIPVMYPGYCPPMMQQSHPMMEGPPLNQGQRDAIENWRQSVL